MVSLLTAIIGTASIFTSCEKNACDGVDCKNGGSCGHGLCTCPTGYEGATCETKSTERYLGVYAGYTTCNAGARVIDTVTIVAGNKGILSVDVYYQSILPKVLHGYVSSNESTYSILVTNNDSSKIGYKHYLRLFDITLQSDKSLKLHMYENGRSDVDDTLFSSCEFLGMKVKK